jgi:hypothetical protein
MSVDGPGRDPPLQSSFEQVDTVVSAGIDPSQITNPGTASPACLEKRPERQVVGVAALCLGIGGGEHIGQTIVSNVAHAKSDIPTLAGNAHEDHPRVVAQSAEKRPRSNSRGEALPLT